MSDTQSDQSTIPANRMVGFGDAIKLGFSNYFQFNGRSSRGAYWYWILFLLAASIVAAISDVIVFPETELTPISTILSLATFIPGLALIFRRLHDIGKTGWWFLIALTIIGLIPLIYWYAQPGQRAENKYGPDSETGR